MNLICLFPVGLKVATNMEQKTTWPCESTHRITVSLDGIEPVHITLPFPVLPTSSTLIALPRKGGVVEAVLEKAIYELWPEDIINDPLRWDAEKLAPWTDKEALRMHLNWHQFRQDYLISKAKKIEKPEVDVMTKVREIILSIFVNAIQHRHERFQLKIEGSTDSPDWFIRAHPPVRTSPRGTPVLLLSALDHHLQERLEREGKLDIDRSKKHFHRIYGHVPAEQKVVITIDTEVAQILRYILRLNCTKILPTSWQTENLPQGKSPSPWLATFVRPLYRDSVKDVFQLVSSLSSLTSTAVNAEITCCAKCGKTGDNLKPCVKCKAVSYCSFDCRRADSAKHKRSCS